MPRVTFQLPHLWIALALVFGLTGACGPIGYVNQVTRKADASVAAAKAVQADKYSPYWYTRAVEYLDKAREEASFADYQAANRFGRKAHEAAIKAKQEAIERAADPSNKDWMPPAGVPDGSPPDGDGLAPADSPTDDDGLAPADPDGDPDVEPENKPDKKVDKKGKKKAGKKKKGKKKKGKKKSKKSKKSTQDKDDGGLAPVIEEGDGE